MYINIVGIYIIYLICMWIKYQLYSVEIEKHTKVNKVVTCNLS